MICNASKLCELYGVNRRTVTNWVNSDPPCPSEMVGRERQFDTVKVAEWRDAQAASRAVAQLTRQNPSSMEESKARKLAAEALLAEIAVAEKEGSLIPQDVHEEVFVDLGDRLMAVIQNVPSNYGLDMERAGVDPATAQKVLEQITDSLVRALRGAADDIDDAED